MTADITIPEIFFEEANLSATFNTDNSVNMSETLKPNNNFHGGDIVVPIVFNKRVMTTAPIWTGEASIYLEAIDGIIEVSYSNFTETKHFSGLQTGSITIDCQNRKLESLQINYTLKDAKTDYQPFYVANELLFDPQLPVKSLNILVVVQTPDKPANYNSYAYLKTNRVIYPPSEQENADNYTIAQWTLNNLNASDYPINTSIQTAVFPGFAVANSNIFLSITALTVALIFELLFFLSVSQKIEVQTKRLKRFPFSSRIHPLLMVIGTAAWISIDFVLKIIGDKTPYTWFSFVYYIVFVYWIQMCVFWPLINLNSYLIRRKTKTSFMINSDRLMLWLRKSPSLVALVFINSIGCVAFLISLVCIMGKFSLYQAIIFLKEPAFFAFSLFIIIASSALVYRFQKHATKELEIVKFTFQSLLESKKTNEIEEMNLIENCEKSGITQKSVRVALEALATVDNLILRKGSVLHLVRREKFVPIIENSLSQKEVAVDIIKMKQKKELFEKETGMQISPSESTEDMAKRMSL